MSYELNKALRNFKACSQDAPAGAHEQAKDLAAVIGETCDNLVRDLRKLGLVADNGDLMTHVEATIYDYVKKSNPGKALFSTAERFGETVSASSSACQPGAVPV